MAPPGRAEGPQPAAKRYVNTLLPHAHPQPRPGAPRGNEVGLRTKTEGQEGITRHTAGINPKNNEFGAKLSWTPVEKMKTEAKTSDKTGGRGRWRPHVTLLVSAKG